MYLPLGLLPTLCSCFRIRFRICHPPWSVSKTRLWFFILGVLDIGLGIRGTGWVPQVSGPEGF